MEGKITKQEDIIDGTIPYSVAKPTTITFDLEAIESWIFNFKGETIKLDAKKFMRILKKFAQT